MNRILLSGVASLFSSLMLCAAEPSAPQMTKPGKVVFEDTLAKGMGKDWTMAKGKWDLDGDAARGAEVKADMHGAVARHAAKFTDGVVAFEFKLDGVKTTSLSLNGAKGHICRVMITPAKFSVNKDDQDGKDGPDKGEVLGTGTVAIKPAEWHTMLVEFRGPEMLATLDGKHHAYGKHAAIEKEKTNLGLTAAGEFVSFRNVKVYEATANPEWDTIKDKVLGKK
ncbi:hypothetical protein BH11PLA2_BH11PLA2_00700 [soil metagenome]